MVLKTDELTIRRVHEKVADKTLPAGARGDVEDADAGDGGSHLRYVLVPEELVTAAHREHRGAALYRFPQRGAVLSGEVRADDDLPLVLTSTEKPHVWPLGVGPPADRVGRSEERRVGKGGRRREE